jgi:hypothetical protein
MPNQYQALQQATAIAGMTVGPDLAADLENKSGTFITKLGNQLIRVVAAPGHSIKSAVAIPDVPGSFMTWQVSARQTPSGQLGQSMQTAGLTPQQRGAATRTRNRSRTPVGT